MKLEETLTAYLFLFILRALDKARFNIKVWPDSFGCKDYNVHLFFVLFKLKELLGYTKVERVSLLLIFNILERVLFKCEVYINLLITF